MDTPSRKARRTFDKMLQVMVSDDLLKAYRQAAKDDGRSVASWVRHILKEAIDKTYDESQARIPHPQGP